MEAISNLQKAIELKPEFPEAYYSLALAFRDKGEIEQAISYLQKALELNPNGSIPVFEVRDNQGR